MEPEEYIATCPICGLKIAPLESQRFYLFWCEECHHYLGGFEDEYWNFFVDVLDENGEMLALIKSGNI